MGELAVAASVRMCYAPLPGGRGAGDFPPPTVYLI
jgi:hypothetical protein